jgi:hypothetical protein
VSCGAAAKHLAIHIDQPVDADASLPLRMTCPATFSKAIILNNQASQSGQICLTWL